MIWSVVKGGVEIWGWREREESSGKITGEVSDVGARDWSAPKYMVREELQKGKLRERAGKGALSFKRRLEEGRGNKLARRC